MNLAQLRWRVVQRNCEIKKEWLKKKKIKKKNKKEWLAEPARKFD